MTFLAIDGGNSKTDVLVASEAGDVLGYVRGPGSSPHALGLDGCVSLLGELVAAVRSRAGLGDNIALARAEVYLAGVDLPGEVTALTEAVTAAGWASESFVDNDTFALLRAGTERADAVAVVCGAGINCAGRAADGRTARFLSLGRISGDWGGGHQLAYEALWHAARGEDGRGEPTALTAAIAGRLGYATVAEVSAALHLGFIQTSEVPRLTPTLFAVADGGDAVARRLVGRLAEEIVTLAVVAQRRLGLLDAPTAAVLGGGVIRAGHALLLDDVAARLRTAAPRAELTVVHDPPVVGAALAGLDALGAPPDAYAALRAEVRRLTLDHEA